MNQNSDKENDPKVQVDGKLVGEINPDNFANESDFIPNVKKEIKQENSEELSLLVTNVQSLNKPPMPKVEELPLSETETDANKPQSDGSNTISKPENAPIRHGPNQFGCPFCPKLMPHSTKMKLHIMKHTGERPFKCNNCEKRFIHKIDLVRHTLTHTGEKPFQCNDCGKRFSQKANLVQHMMIHTGEQPFECNDCGKRFNSKGNFDQHRLTNTEEKKFECNDCGKGFNRKDRLDQHRLRHTGETPFPCTHCGKAFNYKSSLKLHLKTVHSN